jgi:hypothetical protein
MTATLFYKAILSVKTDKQTCNADITSGCSSLQLAASVFTFQSGRGAPTQWQTDMGVY